MFVYAISIDQVKKLDMDGLNTLMPRRMEKAARYRFEDDRLLGIGAGYLMMKHLGLESDEAVEENEYGKLYVPGYPDFSLSHSGEYAVFVMADSTDSGIIGVDIEKVKKWDLRVAKKVYTPREIEWMNEDPTERFFMLWTKKESVMKALGKGFHLPASSFEVITDDEDSCIEVEGKKMWIRTQKFDSYFISVCSSEKIDEMRIIT